MSRLFAGTPFDRPPTCERCGLLEENCQCPPVESQPESIPPEKQTATLRLEKRPKGKVATVVRGLSPLGNNLSVVLTELKSRCGAGGTLADGNIEIQGDHLEKIRTLLSHRGYRVKG